MKTTIIIIPYFGTFPSFFQLFLDSCAFNPNFTWLIHTDSEQVFDVPKNVIIKKVIFSDFKKKIQERFDFEIEIFRPHKLCDFKVAYGYIFEDEIKDYDYWGHGDLDLLYGNLDKFVSPLINADYDKIYSLGHLSLYKNTFEINRVFMDEVDGYSPYKKIFATDKAFAFDEWHCPEVSINHLFLRRNLKFFEVNQCANLASGNENFSLSTYVVNFRNYCIDSNTKNVFSIKNGRLNRHFLIDGKLNIKEYPYVHFHKRNMNVTHKDINALLIVPNEFVPLTEINRDLIIKSSKKKFINTQYLRKKMINLRYRFKQLIR